MSIFPTPIWRPVHVVLIDNTVGCKLLFSKCDNQILHLKDNLNSGSYLSRATFCFQVLFAYTKMPKN